MDTYNFTFRADWIKRINELNPEQRTLTITAIYNYAIYGILSDNIYVNFATSWIRDEIDRMKAARERREARRRKQMEEKRQIADEQNKADEQQEQPTITETPDTENTAPEPSPDPLPDPLPDKNSIPQKNAELQPPVYLSRQQRKQNLNFRDFKRQHKITRLNLN